MIETDLALEKKRRRVAQAKAVDVEKKLESQIAEAGHLAVETFRESEEFSQVKVEFGQEAYVVDQNDGHIKIVTCFSNLDSSFLESPTC